MTRPRILVVDNHDSFTFMLVDYCLTAGAAVDVVQSDSVSVADALGGGFGGVLIAPGPGHPVDAGISVALAAACIAQGMPLLGVCLGQQAIGLACGAQVVRVAPVHGKVGAVRHDGSGLFAGLPSPVLATRYHSLALAGIAPPLIANAWGEDGSVQGVRHADAPAHGVQFHPESVASEHGHALVAAFVAMCA